MHVQTPRQASALFSGRLCWRRHLWTCPRGVSGAALGSKRPRGVCGGGRHRSWSPSCSHPRCGVGLRDEGAGTREGPRALALGRGAPPFLCLCLSKVLHLLLPGLLLAQGRLSWLLELSFLVGKSISVCFRLCMFAWGSRDQSQAGPPAP